MNTSVHGKTVGKEKSDSAKPGGVIVKQLVIGLLISVVVGAGAMAGASSITKVSDDKQSRLAKQEAALGL
jgi:hypothetical protein